MSHIGPLATFGAQPAFAALLLRPTVPDKHDALAVGLFVALACGDRLVVNGRAYTAGGTAAALIAGAFVPRVLLPAEGAAMQGTRQDDLVALKLRPGVIAAYQVVEVGSHDAHQARGALREDEVLLRYREDLGLLGRLHVDLDAMLSAQTGRDFS